MLGRPFAAAGQWLGVVLTLSVAGSFEGCSGGDDPGGTAGRAGSSSGGSGGTSTGGAGGSSTGGTTSSGGSGGTNGSGGSATGGTSGGTAGSGGTTGSGGSTGGTTGSGGTSGKGGAAGTGGSSGKGGAAGTGGSAGKDGGTTPPVDGGGAGIGGKLGKSNFMIGLGPNESPYPASGQLDIRYVYLVGAANEADSWVKWNSPDGEFATKAMSGIDAKGAIPMFDMYEFAADGDGNFAIVRDATYMKRYWAHLQLLADKLKAYNKPAIVHIEPDFWGYAQQNSAGNDPTKFSAQVKIAPTCSDLADDLTGLARCAIRIFHTTSPKAVVGLHASQWAAYDSKGAADGGAVGKFLAAASGGMADYVSTDILDRDAGCFEAKPADYDCDRGGTTGWYWDETNTTSPNFHEYLTWAKALYQGAGVPILWWQTPLGAPSSTPGGSANHYRDNRVHYIFSHIREFIDAGGFGACFGGGAKGQTGVDTDGGQFAAALSNYNAHPEPL